MAITNNGTKNSLSENTLPAGYSLPVVTTFADEEYVRELDLTVLKSAVENADPAVTMANIISDAAVGITKQVDDILAGDYLATATVTAFADIVALSNNYASIKGDGDFLTNTANHYKVKVMMYVKTA